jgi:hypothetical protein
MEGLYTNGKDQVDNTVEDRDEVVGSPSPPWEGPFCPLEPFSLTD